MNFAIVGAGFSGSVLARELAELGHKIQIFESRNHVAGNCYTERDISTGILLHNYGPHIFHTDNEKVWNYVNRFTKFIPYINRVKSTTNGKVYSLPINLHTINQFFNKSLSPNQAKIFIDEISDKSIIDPKSFEEQALKFIGKDLYETFFLGYTLKQWGCSPKLLPASILKRLPVRFDYNDNYFNHKFQGMPINGYTAIVENLLDHINITVKLNHQYSKIYNHEYDHIFYTGPIDSYFEYSEGRLGYRTLDFKREEHEGDFQGCAVMNYGDLDVEYTRISEHKHFSPWESHDKTVIIKEYSRECGIGDIPYYPIRMVNEKKMLYEYIKKANAEFNVSFLGRLGTYRYLDMDVTISEALNASFQVIESLENGTKIPSFFIDPL